jgi:hypothetical protein
MSIFDDFGSPQFGLRDCKVAAWNATNSYGTAVDVPSVQLLGVTLGVKSDKLEGDDRTTAAGARATGGKTRCRFGSVSVQALEVLLGLASDPSGSTPNRQDLLQITGGDSMPYIGICGQAVAEEGSGDTHVFVAKCKIMSDVNLAELELGKFAIPEVELEIVDDYTYGLIQIIEHETETAVVIPPAQ